MAEERDVFVSVGGCATNDQERFVSAIEDRLRCDGFIPHTVGRNTFSADAPLRAIAELLNRCSGAVVIAFERSYFPSGISKRGGPHATTLSEVKLPTSWNQIEAAMAYCLGLPIMVVVETGLRTEGLLERGNDWYVQEVRLDVGALASTEFNGILASWQKRVLENGIVLRQKPKEATAKSLAELSVGELVGSLKPAQLWGVLASLAALAVGAFVMGAKLSGKL